MNPQTGRVHATFQQTTGATGRLISTDPDLQRTPIHTPEGKRIREAFVAPPGRRLIVADWSQIELRLLAHVTGDPHLVEAFNGKRDVHRRTASQIFGVPLADVTPAQREQRAAAALARRRLLGPYRPAEARKDHRLRDLATMARAGFAYDVARKVVDAASPDALDET